MIDIFDNNSVKLLCGIVLLHKISLGQLMKVSFVKTV